MKTLEQTQKQIDLLEQSKEQAAFDQDVHGIEVDMERIGQANWCIKTLEWVIK